MDDEMNLVIADPAGIFWEGALVSREMARSLEARGAATIPVLSDLLQRNAVAGFSKRAWGSGWPLGPVPRRCCPVVLFAVPGLATLNWRARIRLTDGIAMPAEGQLRLVPDQQQQQVVTTGFSADGASAWRLHTLPPADQFGGWTVGGEVRLAIPGEQYLGLACYGFGRGIKVEWLAVSQTR